MHKNCKHCGIEFEIYDEDLKFYEKVSPVFGDKKFLIPPPTFCPDCRQMRRLTYRNERNFYHRKCDLTGADMISVYSPEFKGKVYSQEAWHSDKWDPLSYGRNFDFSRPFFDQFLELSLECPRICVVNMSNENSVYTNHSAYNKNCYMCINTGYSEDLLYCSNYNLYNKDCVDCLAIQHCEMCYFCTHVKRSQFCTYLYECEGCIECDFCYDCNDCKNCFGCFNLRHKQYLIFNEQYSPEEYKKKLSSLKPRIWDEYMKMFEEFKKLKAEKAIHKYLSTLNCINSSGDHIDNNQNVKDSYYVFESEDCRYNYDSGKMKDCYDVTEPFNEQMHYEIHASFNAYHNLFCSKCLESKNTTYSQYCWHCNDVFGCFGLDRYQYCVFNKQYSKEEYEELVPRIIEYMFKNKEWGEFFPSEHSPFLYEETTANDYYPLKKIEYKNKPFKIIPQEADFYKRMNLPEPLIHPDERHMLRMGLRNPRKLRQTVCTKCGKEIETTFISEGEHRHSATMRVYCENCYNGAIY